MMLDAVGQTYGYTKSGAAIAGELKGSYAPITVTPKTNMCGGKKKRRKSKKKRKNRRKIKVENLESVEDLEDEEEEVVGYSDACS